MHDRKYRHEIESERLQYVLEWKTGKRRQYDVREDLEACLHDALCCLTMLACEGFLRK